MYVYLANFLLPCKCMYVCMYSALLYVCAKAKRVKEAENLFWKAIPARNLSYTVATANSLMFMYAKLNK